ncbi:hypothetical protein QNZ58_005091 [Vibrio parahaemolyticus]|nr:hypothetical protein [Vibrio parahaemolyticus]ELB2265162.1 hypothetical protein [Vibrio parahaemolyticus]
MKFKIGLISAAILLSGCATQKMAFPTQNKLTITGNTLVYDGMITGDAVLEAIRMVNDSDQKVTTLRITSSGGDIGVGIEFGHFIKNNDMDVIVSQLCFSACANQSDEMWDQSVPSQYEKQFYRYLTRLRIKEAEFYNKVGVDPNITVYGHTRTNTCQRSTLANGWYYTESDMRHMGIKNLTVQGELLNTLNYNNSEINSCLMPQIFN